MGIYENQPQEQKDMSRRCGDLDRETAYHFGVSKAVLDSVIFCHQEESNWHVSR
jgi:DNA repair protein RAD50